MRHQRYYCFIAVLYSMQDDCWVPVAPRRTTKRAGFATPSFTVVLCAVYCTSVPLLSAGSLLLTCYPSPYTVFLFRHFHFSVTHLYNSSLQSLLRHCGRPEEDKSESRQLCRRGRILISIGLADKSEKYYERKKENGETSPVAKRWSTEQQRTAGSKPSLCQRPAPFSALRKAG